MSDLDLIKRINDLQRQVDGLIKPEVGRWVDISASVSLYQAAAVAATVNYAKALVENKKVTIIASLAATAAGTIANNIYCLIPAVYTPASGISSPLPLGEGTYVDGVVFYTCGVFYIASVGGLPAFGLRVSAITDGNVIGTNPSIAVASGDVFSFDATFEIG